MELICQYEISKDLKYINEDQFDYFIINAHNLAVKISNFKSYMSNRKD